jgi:hypothetical protein
MPETVKKVEERLGSKTLAGVFLRTNYCKTERPLRKKFDFLGY